MPVANSPNFKMKNITLLGFLVLFFISCRKEQPLEIKGESLTENELEICRDRECPEISVDYLEASGKSAVADSLNKKIKDFIVFSLSLEENPNMNLSITKAAEEFANSYFEDRTSFPDMTGSYSAIIRVRELYNSPDMISFEMYQYLYTGGAHGFGSTRFLNIDPKTGKEFLWHDLFSNDKEFTSFAEKRFRIEKNIHPEQSINEPGFWFENDTFNLPPSVGFTQDSIIFVYNQYDIASYAEGPIELKLSKEEARHFLKIGEK